MRWIAWIATIVGLALGQQPKVEEQQAFPIEKIIIKGSKQYTPEILGAYIGLKVGDTLEDAKLKAAYEKLVNHGAFAHVNYWFEPADSQKGYNVTYEVTDIDQLMPMRFDRMQVDEAKLREHLKKLDPLFQDKIPPLPAVMERYRAAVEAFTGGKDKIEVKVSSESGADLFVLFSPVGGVFAVAEVSFTGNKVVPTQLLQSAIHGVAVGVEYSERRFREMLEHGIVPIYEARGRLRVSFPKVEIKMATGVKGVHVSVTVDEGESYSFGEIRVIGAPMPSQELVKASGIKSGEVVNMDAAKEGQTKVHSALHRLGYMKVSSKIDRQVNDKEKVCGIVMQIEPGQQFRFGKLYMKGLDLHGEHEIKRIWVMKQGDIFNADYPGYFLGRLVEDGIFDNLQNSRPVITPDEASLTVDVTLIFNEKKAKPAANPGV
jgi:outer membrane protein assembly factor BamA